MTLFSVSLRVRKFYPKYPMLNLRQEVKKMKIVKTMVQSYQMTVMRRYVCIVVDFCTIHVHLEVKGRLFMGPIGSVRRAYGSQAMDVTG